MKGSVFISNEEKNEILKKHNSLYDGYATNMNSNLTPLTVYDPYKDKNGITINSKGEIKHYQNHRINEIAAKNLHYDEIDPAYEFDSQGPGDVNLGYNVYNNTKPPYDFDSKGPVDVYEEDEAMGADSQDDPVFSDYVDDEVVSEDQKLYESINNTLGVFKKLKNITNGSH